MVGGRLVDWKVRRQWLVDGFNKTRLQDGCFKLAVDDALSFIPSIAVAKFFPTLLWVCLLSTSSCIDTST